MNWGWYTEMFLKKTILSEFGLLPFPELKNTLHYHPANIYEYLSTWKISYLNLSNFNLLKYLTYFHNDIVKMGLFCW